jgi:hypothetical protein
MKVIIPLLLVAIILLGLGGEGLYRAATSRHARAVACDDVIQAPPSGAALRIVGCELDYLAASHRASNGVVSELLFPVKKPGQPAGTPTSLVAVTREPVVLAFAQEIIGGDRRAEGEAFVVMMLRIVTAMEAAREIQGVTRGSLLHRLQDRRSLAAVRTPLAPGAIVLQMHGRPDWLVPAVASGLGLLALAAATMMGRSRGQKSAVAAMETVQTLAPEPPPAGGIVEPVSGSAVATGSAVASADERAPAPTGAHRAFRGLMLLNLPPDAGRDAIEHAPALGTREDVRRRLEELLDHVRLDERGRGNLATPDLQLAIDIGTDPVIWTAIVHAEGAEAATRLRQIAEATRWRIYVPRDGSFLDAAALEHP